MEAAGCFEMLAFLLHATWHHIPDDNNLIYLFASTFGLLQYPAQSHCATCSVLVVAAPPVAVAGCVCWC